MPTHAIKEVYIDTTESQSWVSGPLICVIFGSSTTARKFLVHKGLIMKRSEFSETALNGRWAESDDSIIKFPEDGHAVFELYLQVLYTNAVPVREKLDNNPSNAEESTTSAADNETREKLITAAANREFDKLIPLYTLCDMLRDQESKKLVFMATFEAVNHLRDGRFRSYPEPRHANVLYQGTNQGDSMRKFFIDLYQHAGKPAWLTSQKAQDINLGFTFELAVALMEGQKDPDNVFNLADYLVPMEQQAAAAGLTADNAH